MARRPKPQDGNQSEPSPSGPLAPLGGSVARQQANTSPSQQNQISVEHWEFQGPLPPPAVLAAYEHLAPGATERLLKRMEKQSDHRMDMEKTHLHADVWVRKAGVYAATFLCGMAVAGSVYVSYIGKQWEPLGFGGLALLIPAAVQVWSRRDARAERQAKAQIMAELDRQTRD